MFLSDSLFCFLPCRLSLSLIIIRKFHIAIVEKNPPNQETWYVSKLIAIHMHGGITFLLLYLWYSTIAPLTFICLNEYKQKIRIESNVLFNAISILLSLFLLRRLSFLCFRMCSLLFEENTNFLCWTSLYYNTINILLPCDELGILSFSKQKRAFSLNFIHHFCLDNCLDKFNNPCDLNFAFFGGSLGLWLA